MSEEAEVKPKKGGNKMMIIVIAVLMLVTGGFFGLKMKGGDKKSGSNEIHMGKEVEDIDEFLVNLQDDSVQQGKYLRTKISVQCAEGFKKEVLDTYKAPVQDAILGVLASYSVGEISSPKGKEILKRKVAAAANEALLKSMPEEDKKALQTLLVHDETKHHADWDSESGPILRVYFTTFAFQ
ncbi:MAG TPA: flagellar basal body-associated FliL family protein [Fimbriimonadaceae bacterium]|jgi:flagellar basal body-associated protein FliL